MNVRSATDIDAYVGQRIRHIRKKRKMSQEVLAEKCGITFQQIQKYENARNRVSASRLTKLSEVLEVPIQNFFPEEFTESKRPDFVATLKLSYNSGSVSPYWDIKCSEYPEVVMSSPDLGVLLNMASEEINGIAEVVID